MLVYHETVIRLNNVDTVGGRRSESRSIKPIMNVMHAWSELELLERQLMSLAHF